jgi:hypothetical protein
VGKHRPDVYKSKANSVTVRGGQQGCELLKISHCLYNRLTDGGELRAPDALYSTEHLFICLRYSFLLGDD